MEIVPSQVLDETYDFLTNVGWCRDEFILLKNGEAHTFGTPTPDRDTIQGACLFGAVAYTMNVLPYWLYVEPVTIYLMEALSPSAGAREVVEWNNHPCRKKQEVLDLVQKAANLARAKGT